MRYTQGLIVPPESVMSRNRTDITATPLNMLAFPQDQIGGHGIVLNFSRYTYDKNADLQNKVVISSIMLPIPSNLNDSFNIRINQAELGLSGSIAARSASSMTNFTPGAVLGAGLGDVGDIIESVKDAVLGSGDMTFAAIAALQSSLVSDEDRKGFEAGFGRATNPHLALSFDGVDLKQHTFQWQLAPRNSRESETLKKIITKVKKNVLPRISSLGVNMFEYPNVVDIFFVGTEPGYLYYFKRCLMSSFETNYAGSGNVAFVEGGRPAVINLSMTLTEMDIHTSEDYQSESESIAQDAMNALNI